MRIYLPTTILSISYVRGIFASFSTPLEQYGDHQQALSDTFHRFTSWSSRRLRYGIRKIVSKGCKVVASVNV